MTPDTIVFLHIPKTAGQTIHNALVGVVGGPAHVSPVRTHTQATPETQFPPGYRLYSGHIDWIALADVPRPRFVFTVLRDPRERIASFYFYLLKEARALSPEALARPENTGKRKLLEMSVDDYFLGGDAAWQGFIRDHYDNFYCSYFATGRMRGHRLIRDLDRAALLARAQDGLAQLDRVYLTTGLAALEEDIATRYGQRIRVAGQYHNTGSHALDEQRWPRLMAALERDASRGALEGFAAKDEALMAALSGETAAAG